MKMNLKFITFLFCIVHVTMALEEKYYIVLGEAGFGKSQLLKTLRAKGREIITSSIIGYKTDEKSFFKGAVVYDSEDFFDK